MNDLLLNDDTLVITDNSNKEYLIKYISSLDKLVNTRIMTTKELIDNYYFKYSEQSILYLMQKYHYKADIAKMYISNMYYVNESSKNKKINKVYELKQELIDNNLLEYNTQFKEYLNSKHIIIYNMLSIPNIIKTILGNYDYQVINNYPNNYNHTIYEYNNLDDEVVGIANKIAELIKNDVDINHIYLVNLNDEYRLIINRIFSLYKIPVYLHNNYSIYNTSTVKKFLDYYEDDINRSIVLLKDNIKESEIDIYNKIVNVCNKYMWCEHFLEIKDLIINELKNISIDNNIMTNCVREGSISSTYTDDDYVFLPGFNQGIIPIIHKDEDYFNDKEKSELGIETSVDKNNNEKLSTISIIKNIKNLYISYKLNSLTDTYIVSNIIDDLGYEVVTVPDNYTNSHLYNELELSKSLDLFNKYGTVSDKLNVLYSNYHDTAYMQYSNKYTGIDVDSLDKYLDNKLLLSYSSIDNYGRCAFRYYLNNILKINIYEETFMQFIGNLFHYVLSEAFKPGFNYDECFDNYINKELSKKEAFFIKKLKEELKFIIDTINYHNTHTELTNELYEKKIYVNLDGNIQVTFMGIIDKLKYKELDDGRHVVAIIDYKTGNPNLNLNNVIYGIEMQLPIYCYLAKHYEEFDNIEIAGFYLQKILNNEIIAKEKCTYDDLKRKNLLLQGYSNSNEKILSMFDDDYNDSTVIKSMRTSSKGFYAYSKVLDSSTIDKLVNLTEEKIKEASENILKAKFDINPKRIGVNNIGCEYCKFNDICYHSEGDMVNLKEYKNLEFLGGDDNA